MSSNIQKLSLAAKKENLSQVISFIEACLESLDCPPKASMQINIAVEEIFVNVASYAYGSEEGDVTISVDAEPDSISIVFEDSGIPYDPLKKPDPDITLSVEKRAIGGLGIFMTKKMMDDMSYEYKDGMNILTLKKYY